ncbi:MAG TPA: hypothetical protein VGG48_19335 [Rhizomicrobium sp.]|jgi:hypothetical protein
MLRFLAAAILVCAIASSGLLGANAKGCVKGAAVGAVAGHFMHRHTLLGAVVGCAVGHHEAVKKEREEKAAAAQKAQTAH